VAEPTLSSFKDFLDIKSGEFDGELPSYLLSAESTIVHRCGPIRPTEFTETSRAECGEFVVSHWPIIEVTSVVDDDGREQNLSRMKVDKNAGVVRLRNALTGPIEVTLTAGYPECPDDLETAVYVVGGHLWDTQRGRSGSFAQIHGMDDDAPVGGDASFFVMQGMALPRRAMELTRPYVKAGFR
jgi:hypothetical protein